MKPPLFVRELSDAQRRSLQAGLRSRAAFTLRRAPILLASADGLRPSAIAARVGCSVGTVHDAIRAFAGEGVACLTETTHGPKDARPVLDEAKADPLRGILHQSPRQFGKARSTWTLDLRADVAFERGLTPRRLSHEAVRQAVKRLGSGWRRAKQWITSPDPAYTYTRRRFHSHPSSAPLSSARPVRRAVSEKNASGSRLRAWQYAPVRAEHGLWPPATR